jgi:molybdenum ABC transporter molybdate-binding protein
MKLRQLAFGISIAVNASVGAQQPSVQLYAAGSLRASMTELVQAFSASGGPPVKATYGPSGLLRERIEKGEPVDVFASADMGNVEALARTGRAARPVVFARNKLCALVAPDVAVTSETLLDRMLDPGVKLGTSTPKADPSGDYAWMLFERAEKQRSGAFKALDAKALKLVGGRDSPQPPPDRTIYGVMIAERKADIFLTYCTNAMQAVREVPGARMVAVPEPLSVGAEYGLTALRDAPPSAARFVDFVMSQEGQGILGRHGFAPGDRR